MIRHVDPIEINVLCLRDQDYIRFDKDLWYKHDKINDCYIRCQIHEYLEEEFEKALEEQN